MAGTLVVGSGEVLEGTIKVSDSRVATLASQPYKFVYYHSGTPAGAGGSPTAGYVSTTTETELVVLDIGGLKNFALALHNRDDEDIDGGGKNNKDITVYVDGSNDPDFGACVVPIINGTVVGEGVETTWHFGEGIRGWIDTTETPLNYDFDGSSLVTIANEGFPFRYLKIGLKAETENSPAYFEAWLYAI